MIRDKFKLEKLKYNHDKDNSKVKDVESMAKKYFKAKTNNFDTYL